MERMQPICGVSVKRRAAGLILFVGLLGCGKSEPLAQSTVRGRVLFQGRALAGGTIAFTPHPERGPSGKSAIATLDDNGEFRLKSAGTAYLPAGWYRIAVAEAPSADAGYTSTFPMELSRPDKSGLDREVIAGRENVFEFAVELR